jgi:hypothetical protein
LKAQQGWVVQKNIIFTILALNQLDLTEGDNANIDLMPS